jgi:hypothetical protein
MTKGDRPGFWLYRPQHSTPVPCPFLAAFFLNPLINLSRGKANAPFNMVKGNPLLADQLIDPHSGNSQHLGKVGNGQKSFHKLVLSQSEIPASRNESSWPSRSSSPTLGSPFPASFLFSAQ